MEKIHLTTISEVYKLSKEFGDSKALRKILFLIENEGGRVAYKSLINDDKNYIEECNLLNKEGVPLIRFDFFKNKNISKKTYLGYIQLRPSNKEWSINDAFIKIPESSVGHLSHFITCATKYVFYPPDGSKPFSILGTFFAQRDGILGVCTHACLRMLSYYKDKKLLTIPEIKKDVGEEVETIGLEVPEQIETVLKHHGFNPHVYSSLYSADFLEEEFVYPLTINGLCKAIKVDNYDITIDVSENTVSWINRLLQVTDLYEKIHNKKPGLKFSQDIINLIGETEDYRGKNFSGLTDRRKDIIKKLNRLLLEETYPHNTPKKISFSIEEIIYIYVESCIPVLVVFETSKEVKKIKQAGELNHMVLIVGHTFDPHAWWPEAHKKYYQKLPYGQYLTSSSWVNFVGHDDNFGPYLTFPRNLQGIWTVIVPMPIPLELKAEYINPLIYRAINRDTIKERVATANSIWSECFLRHLKEDKLLFRTFLIDKHDFLKRIKDTNVSKGVKDFYHSELFDPPDKFWITEISVPEIFSQQRYCLGEIITDPNPPVTLLRGDLTPEALDDIIRYYHLMGTIIIPKGHQGKEWYVPIKDDVPYRHIIRS